MFAIGDCRNCQRVGESTDHSLLVRSWSGRMDMWMRTISLGGYNNCFGSFSSLTRSSKSSQSLTSENRIDEILFHFFFFCFCLRRNSCADSLRGQYARMGPLQYLFLCGLLHTQTYGKFIQCMHLLLSVVVKRMSCPTLCYRKDSQLWPDAYSSTVIPA